MALQIKGASTQRDEDEMIKKSDSREMVAAQKGR